MYIACTTEEGDKLSTIDSNEFIGNWYLLEAMQVKQLENVRKSNLLVAEASKSMARSREDASGVKYRSKVVILLSYLCTVSDTNSGDSSAGKR